MMLRNFFTFRDPLINKYLYLYSLLSSAIFFALIGLTGSVLRDVGIIGGSNLENVGIIGAF